MTELLKMKSVTVTLHWKNHDETLQCGEMIVALN